MKEQKWITLLDVIDHEDNGFLYLWQHRPSQVWVSTAGESKAEYTFLHGVQWYFFRVITLIIRIDFHWELLSLDTQVGSFLGLCIC